MDQTIQCPFGVQDADFVPRSNLRAHIFEFLEQTHIGLLFGLVISPLLDLAETIFTVLITATLKVYSAVTGVQSQARS